MRTKDQSITGEFFVLQQKLATLRAHLVKRNRQAALDAQWTTLPIRSAKANELAGLQKTLELREQQGKKNNKALEKQIQSFDKDRYQAQTLSVQNGEMLETDDIPARVLYELTLSPEYTTPKDNRVTPLNVTALKVAVPPVAPEQASHTAEGGFIIDAIYLQVLHADGSQEDVPFARYFSQPA
jgi:hypothetical protein